MYILYCLLGIFLIAFIVAMVICLHKKRQNKRHEFKPQIPNDKDVQQKNVEESISEPQIIYDHKQFAIEGAVLTKYLGKDLDVKIPKGVKAIGMYAFAFNERIRQVSIPLGVEKIMGNAFSVCTMLTSVNLIYGQ